MYSRACLSEGETSCWLYTVGCYQCYAVYTIYIDTYNKRYNNNSTIVREPVGQRARATRSKTAVLIDRSPPPPHPFGICRMGIVKFGTGRTDTSLFCLYRCFSIFINWKPNRSIVYWIQSTQECQKSVGRIFGFGGGGGQHTAIKHIRVKKVVDPGEKNLGCGHKREVTIWCTRQK